jgi:hypothetical protein
MSNSPHFRPAAPADYERMLAIWLQGQLQSLGIETKANDTYREELIRLFSDSQNLVQVAEYEGLVVGWIF